MLIDAEALGSGTELSAKFCVIGSGMGGSTVAQQLAAAKQDVLVIEAGGLRLAEEHTALVSAEHAGRAFNLPTTRCIELGGTSNQWHGICAPLDPIDFERRSWIADSGWPISYADLAPFYSRAARVLDIPDAAFDEKFVPQKEGEPRQQLEFNRAILRPKLVYMRRPPMRWKQTLKDLASSGKIRCALNTAALELAANESGRVTALKVGTPRGIRTVRADVYIVACGGLETPRLLLNSRSLGIQGLGNAYDQVGRHLMDHPAGHFCKIRFVRTTRAPLYSGIPVSKRVALMSGLMLKPDVQEKHGLPNHYVWIRPSVTAQRIDDKTMLSFLKVRGPWDLSLEQVRAILMTPDILYRVLVHRFGVHPSYRYGDLWFMTEQLPNARSRVVLSTKRDRFGYPISRVEWNLSEDDIRGFEQYTELLFAEGLIGEQHRLARRDEHAVWERTVASAAHHLGTARMAHSERHGVVDRDLKIFGTSNAFVSDASVFATSGSVNPSLTITAFAIRLADHLLRSTQNYA